MIENENNRQDKLDNYFLDEQKRIFEIARNTQFSLWNALLSLNAIIITVFTGLLSLKDLSNRCLLLSIISISVLSALLILINFILTKRYYFDHYKKYPDLLKTYSPMEEIELQTTHNAKSKKSENIHTFIDTSERTSIILLIIELILIVVFAFI